MVLWNRIQRAVRRRDHDSLVQKHVANVSIFYKNGFPSRCFTVGAVYDRAFVAFESKKRAVTDRAYS